MTTILLILLFLILFVLYMLFGLFCMVLFCGILLIIEIYWIVQREKCFKLRPTQKICPNCGCTSVRIGSEVSGSIGIAMPIYGMAVGSSRNITSRIMTCNDCEHRYTFITQQDIDGYMRYTTREIRIDGVLLLISTVITAYFIINLLIK